MAAPTTEDVGSETYNVYADIDTADTYMTAALHGASWRAATIATKGMSLVTSTRVFDRQIWKGEKLDPDQPLQFPRTNMGIDGLDDSAGVTPDAITAGSIELALALIDGSEAQDNQTTAERIRSLTAGSVSISNFRGTDSFLGSGGGTRFPLIVQELVGPYLEGGSSNSTIGRARAFGVDNCTRFPGRYGFTDGGV